jgi:hypothetical protein
VFRQSKHDWTFVIGELIGNGSTGGGHLIFALVFGLESRSSDLSILFLEFRARQKKINKIKNGEHSPRLLFPVTVKSHNLGHGTGTDFVMHSPKFSAVEENAVLKSSHLIRRPLPVGMPRFTLLPLSNQSDFIH